MDDEISQEKSENGTIAVIENEKKEEENSKKILNPRKIKILIAIALGNLFLGCCFSSLAPIFPPKAEEKNASPTAYGFVFGIYPLAQFLSSPIYGKLVPILKPKFMLKAGMFVSGVCNILFGLLDYAPSGAAFIGLALTIRFFDALGACAFFISSYAILGSELSDCMGRAVSLSETALTVGNTVGPVFGGFFFQLGGFHLPFTVIGLILIGGMIINIFLFSGDDGELPRKTISILALLKNFDFMIDILTIMIAYIFLAFNEVSLEPHIRQLSTSPVTTGLVFLASALASAICSPIWGYLAEKVPNAHYLIFSGSLMTIISFLILGPAPFMNFKLVLWVVVVSQVILGIADASFCVCSLAHGMKHSIERGFPDEVGTYGVVSSVVLSAGFLGGFVGPSLGGILIDKIGYINTTMLSAGLGALLAVICAGRLIHLCFKNRR